MPEKRNSTRLGLSFVVFCLSGIRDFHSFFKVDIQLRQNLTAVRLELKESKFPLSLHFETIATQKPTLKKVPAFP